MPKKTKRDNLRKTEFDILLMNVSFILLTVNSDFLWCPIAQVTKLNKGYKDYK